MSESKSKSFLPLRPMPPSDDEDKKSPMKDRVAMYASQMAQPSRASSNISPVPAGQNAKMAYGQLFTPAHGRLTPTVQGRIKAPPVCVAPSLKRVASGIQELSTEGVCFSPKEAENCAKQALALGRREFNGANVEDMPLNVERCGPEFSLPEGRAFISSNSTVITTSTTSSCGRSIMGNEIPVTARKGPPLEVVRTDFALNSEDEHHPGSEGSAALSDASTTPKAGMPQQLSASTAPEKFLTVVSTEFRNNLVKEKSSRQGRSMQRWLIHSPTHELVRQVAGTIPITQDGRIILVSASRKTEWILPKGGWDEDETKEECAARETFEEAGLIGRLGGCLEPIDYESNKAKKRRLSKLGNGGGGKLGTAGDKGEFKKGKGKTKMGARETGDCEGFSPSSPKRAKTISSTTSPELISSIKKAGSYEFSDSFGSAKGVSNVAANQATMPAAKQFDPKNYSYVRLFLCPLYVTSVKSDWPEKGRLRKLVDIDEAIKIMKAENRLYFLRGLEMVKERGLHLLKPEVISKLGSLEKD